MLSYKTSFRKTGFIVSSLLRGNHIRQMAALYAFRVKEVALENVKAGKEGLLRHKNVQTFLENWSPEFLTSIFLKSPMTSLSVSLADLNIEPLQNPQLKHISCSLCKDLLKRPVVLQCNHAYCSICLVGHSNTHIQGKLPECIECKAVIPPSENSLQSGVFLSQIMESVNVKLKCGCSTQLASSKSHICTMSTKDILNLTPTKE